MNGNKYIYIYKKSQKVRFSEGLSEAVCVTEVLMKDSMEK